MNCPILCENPTILLNPQFVYLVSKYSYIVFRDELISCEKYRQYSYTDFESVRKRFSVVLNGIHLSDLDTCFFTNLDKAKQEPLYIAVPCNHCRLCISRKIKDYTTRCVAEYASTNFPPYMITLTYNDTYVPKYHTPYGDFTTFDKRDIQLFFKRLRKRFPDCTLKYLCVGEYGSHTGRAHYHFLLFGVDPSIYNAQDVYIRVKVSWSKLVYLPNDNGKKERHLDSMGFIYSDKLKSIAGIKYCMKYLAKSFDHSDTLLLMSRRPSLGAAYFDSVRQQMVDLENASLLIKVPNSSTPYKGIVSTYVKNRCFPTCSVFFKQTFVQNVKRFNYLMSLLSTYFNKSLNYYENVFHYTLLDTEREKIASFRFTFDCIRDLYDDIKDKFCDYHNFYYSNDLSYDIERDRTLRCFLPIIDDFNKLFEFYSTHLQSLIDEFQELYDYFNLYLFDANRYAENVRMRNSIVENSLGRTYNIEAQVETVTRKVTEMYIKDMF